MKNFFEFYVIFGAATGRTFHKLRVSIMKMQFMRGDNTEGNQFPQLP